MKMTAKFLVPKIKLAAYRKELDRYMKKVIVEATQAWLMAVIGEIPVWSGASRATFLKLASAVKFNIEINPVVIDRTGIGSSLSEGRIETKDGQYTFYYSTTLPWLIWNEYNNANLTPDPTLFYRVKKEGPYNFQVEGRDAFKLFADTITLPLVEPFVTSRHKNV